MAVARLVGQMSSRGEPDASRVRLVADAPTSRIVVARCESEIVATATLLWFETIVGRFGYVEEVAVEQTLRGQGLGRGVMRRIGEVAIEHDLDFVELTSRPARVTANGLYRSPGLDQRKTNVFRMRLRPANRLAILARDESHDDDASEAPASRSVTASRSHQGGRPERGGYRDDKA